MSVSIQSIQLQETLKRQTRCSYEPKTFLVSTIQNAVQTGQKTVETCCRAAASAATRSSAHLAHWHVGRLRAPSRSVYKLMPAVPAHVSPSSYTKLLAGPAGAVPAVSCCGMSRHVLLADRWQGMRAEVSPTSHTAAPQPALQHAQPQASGPDHSLLHRSHGCSTRTFSRIWTPGGSCRFFRGMPCPMFRAPTSTSMWGGMACPGHQQCTVGNRVLIQPPLRAPGDNSSPVTCMKVSISSSCKVQGTAVFTVMIVCPASC